MKTAYDDLVIGGGLFGCCAAIHLAQQGRRVRLVEKEPQLCSGASSLNQARVHGGYHYPRSFLTAKRSRANLDKFLERFGECVYSGFKNYYAIARYLSHVGAKQFSEFCRRIEAPLSPAPKPVQDLWDSSLIEDVFEVEEPALDAAKLRKQLARELKQAGVVVTTSLIVRKVEKSGDHLEVTTAQGKEGAKDIWLCAYSGVNELLKASSLELIPLRMELAELCLVAPPKVLEGIGLTVMDGPFFSLMPYPALKKYTLSHVRYTPHLSCEDQGQGAPSPDGIPSNFGRMVRDASRYCPVLKDCVYEGSLWATKSLLPRSDTNDSRPILFKRDHALRGLHCILGGKLDNVFDALELLVPESTGQFRMAQGDI